MALTNRDYEYLDQLLGESDDTTFPLGLSPGLPLGPAANQADFQPGPASPGLPLGPAANQAAGQGDFQLGPAANQADGQAADQEPAAPKPIVSSKNLVEALQELEGEFKPPRGTLRRWRIKDIHGNKKISQERKGELEERVEDTRAAIEEFVRSKFLPLALARARQAGEPVTAAEVIAAARTLTVQANPVQQQ